MPFFPPIKQNIFNIITFCALCCSSSSLFDVKLKEQKKKKKRAPTYGSHFSHEKVDIFRLNMVCCCALCSHGNCLVPMEFMHIISVTVKEEKKKNARETLQLTDAPH